MPTAKTQTPNVQATSNAKLTGDVAVELPKSATKTVNRFVQARMDKAKVEKEYNEAKDALRALFPEATVTAGTKYIGKLKGIARVKISPRTRTGIDRKMLVDAFPEAAEQCTTSTTYEQIDTV